MIPKIGFVILHYLVSKDTIECVETIVSHCRQVRPTIVIVDNASPDESGKMLEEKYKYYSEVHVIQCTKNMGFSKGNNVGIHYARIEKKCDFIVVLNNDTCILQDDFIDIIINEYENSAFGVMGPQVLDPYNKNYSSPLWQGEKLSVNQLKGNVNIWKKNYLKSVFALDDFHPFARKYKSTIECEQREPCFERLTDVELHGCCLIFSPRYFKYYDGFEELTFMYGEETILKMNCDKYGLPMVYNPELKIFHKEAVATKKEYTSRKKKIQHNKRMLDAAMAIYKKAIAERGYL